MTAPSQQPPSSLFVQLFAKHQCALNSFIGSLVPTRADVDDVMQETSLALWKKWNDFDVSRDFFRWACGIAHIEVLRHRRKTATDRLWLCEELIELLSVEMLERTELFDMRRDALESCVKKRLGILDSGSARKGSNSMVAGTSYMSIQKLPPVGLIH